MDAYIMLFLHSIMDSCVIGYLGRRINRGLINLMVTLWKFIQWTMGASPIPGHDQKIALEPMDPSLGGACGTYHTP